MHVTPLQLSADTEPEPFAMALLAQAGSPRPGAWHTVLLLLVSSSQLGMTPPLGTSGDVLRHLWSSQLCGEYQPGKFPNAQQ